MIASLNEYQKIYVKNLFLTGPFHIEKKDDDSIFAAYYDIKNKRHILNCIDRNDVVATILYFNAVEFSKEGENNLERYCKKFFGLFYVMQVLQICIALNIYPNEISHIKIKSTFNFIVKNNKFPHDVYQNDLASCVLFFKEYRRLNATHRRC